MIQRKDLVLCGLLSVLRIDFSGADDITRVVDVVNESQEDPTHSKAWFILSGKVEFLSNYLDRGISQTFGRPAVQGELLVSQREEDGFYAGVWGSNVDNETAPNGSNMELDLYGGYKYKPDCIDDLLFVLDLKATLYPGARANLPTKDRYNGLELTPGIQYKYLSQTFAYSLKNSPGVNENFAPTYDPPLRPNGDSKGSWYAETNFEYPFIEDILSLTLTYGHQYVRHYTKLNYNVYQVNISYTAPDCIGGFTVSVSGATNDAKKSLYTNENGNGKTINTARSCFWVGISKSF